MAANNTQAPKPATARIVDDSSSNELRQEGRLVASTGRISKRTMVIAFGLVFLGAALTSTQSLGIWGTGVVSLLGLSLTIWGVVQVVRRKLE